jgi:hypothetical protein
MPEIRFSEPKWHKRNWKSAQVSPLSICGFPDIHILLKSTSNSKTVYNIELLKSSKYEKHYTTSYRKTLITSMSVSAADGKVILL